MQPKPRIYKESAGKAPSKIEVGQRVCHNTVSNYPFWDRAPNKTFQCIHFQLTNATLLSPQQINFP